MPSSAPTKNKLHPEMAKAIGQLRKDPVLRKLIDSAGPCTLAPKKEFFFILCDSIISQQLSVKASATIVERFRKLGKSKHPTPLEVLAFPEQKLRACGLSAQKVSYVKDLAQHFHDGRIVPSKFHVLSDDEIVAELVAVKGIGRWTAEMFLIFSLCRLDVWPVDDLGIKKAVQLNYKLKTLPTGKDLGVFAQKKSWSPYRTVASWYLWRSLANT